MPGEQLVTETTIVASNFIRSIMLEHVKHDKHTSKLVTRFPPEPNGYLHIGHAVSICLNFGLAQEFGGLCNLRFDDTNPGRESQEYIQSIKRDVSWLGFSWHEKAYYASNYFSDLYGFAIELIEKNLAYVCDLTPEQARKYRGSLTQPGCNSPYRERSIAKNLDLFERMKRGQFGDGERVLRAKINMASPNMNMRDPIIYRIRHTQHHQTGNQWCIYPMYDFTHGLCDALEHVTHSICTLEFEDHRPLYDWFIENVTVPSRPHQYEFARLEINYTITSKRKLKLLVDEGWVQSWDDPRMPTLSGMRRRGYTPRAIRNFCAATPVARNKGITDISRLETAVRDDLDTYAPRAMCVINPLKLTIANWPNGHSENLSLPIHPKDVGMGYRKVSMGRNLYIDQADFAEQPPRKWKRLAPGQAVRLRGSYIIHCVSVIKDANDKVIELICHYDHDTLGSKPQGYRANGVIHWVNDAEAIPLTVNLYDRLFNHPNPEADKEIAFTTQLNPNSLVVVTSAIAEPSIAKSSPGDHFQFEREGYFCVDIDSCKQRIIVNRTLPLKDSWVKINS